MNWYAYVGNDPINGRDPSGLACGLVANDAGVADFDTKGGHCGPSGGGGNGGGLGGVGGVGGGAGGGGGRPGVTLGLPDFSKPVQREPQQAMRRPDPCEAAFLKDQLRRRGLPTRQIDNLTFVSGLNSRANRVTRAAFETGAGAVTQGSTVYVQPSRFDEVANFRSSVGFEEAYHSAQFANDGSFYTTYGVLSIGGKVIAGDSYNGNIYEIFSKAASKEMFREFRDGMSK